jgi:hypothetical protein
VSPVEPPYTDDVQAALDELGVPIQLFRVFARRPAMATALAGWGRYYLSRASALTVRQRELVIDRTTALCRADYEWGIHVAIYAQNAAFTPEQIDSLAGGLPSDTCWTAEDAALLHAVDELHASFDLGDQTWSKLAQYLGEDACVELLLLAGWYHAISFAVRALRLPMEPGTDSNLRASNDVVNPRRP